MKKSPSNGIKFLYTLKRSRRARRLRLVVRAGGSVEVIAPLRVPREWVEKMVEERRTWIEKSVRRMNERGEGKKFSEDEIKELREKAMAIVLNRLEFFNQEYGLRWNMVKVKKMATRWGSCSRKGNLNFNYRIALLPPELVDYIVVHELCHLAQMNHSEKFWRLVARAIPDVLERRRAIRKYSLA